jgi:tungstate transport system ATP-binding protein
VRATTSDLPIKFDAVSFSVRGVEILKEVSFSIVQGGPAIILGPNGSGKTTVLKLAMGLLQPASGSITWGANGGAHFDRRAFVFQRPVMLRRSVSANVAYALRASDRWVTDSRVSQLLEQVGLAHLPARAARKLSAGEQQRLALARAMAREPEILFLDEPTASLDPAAMRAVEEIIRGFSSRGTKIVMATHDLAQARRLGAYIMLFVNGRLVEEAPPCQFFSHPQAEEAKRFLDGEIVI